MIVELQSVLSAFFAFEAYVMLPIIILVIALILRMKLTDALLSALKLGVGFAGVFIIFNFFVDNLSPAVRALAENRGLDFPVLDVGWPPLAAITWSSVIGPLSIPFVILLNVIMLATNTTRTVYIDLWNVWQFALMGALIVNLTESVAIGLVAVVLTAVYSFKTADWSEPYVRREVGLEGVTVSPLSVTGLVPYAVTMDMLYDKIPGFRKLDFNPERQGKEIGPIGEPMVIGVIVGLLLGIAAGYSFKETLELGVHIAAVMFLLPKSAALIGAGFQPISEHLKVVITRRFPKKRDLYFAIDTGVIMGHKSVMATGLILMPISLLLALIIPGNKTLPLGDLPNLISVMSLMVLASRGNVVRGVVTAIPIVVGYLLISSEFAPLYTALSKKAGVSIAEGQLITALTDGGNVVRYWFYYLFQMHPVALLLIPPVGFMMYLAWKRFRAFAA